MTTTYLEQNDPGELTSARSPATPATIVRVTDMAPEFCRFLYAAVGGEWCWLDRLGWSLRRWTDHLSCPGSETWVAWVDGAPAGYVELAVRQHADGSHVEIAYFGLLRRYFGRGLGGQLLEHGLRCAWTLHERDQRITPVTRVWVHTSSLDGPHALGNYRARGMSPYRTEEADDRILGCGTG